MMMKSKLKGHFGDDIVITELHCERNVVIFCLTVVSVIFLKYFSLNQPRNHTPDYGKIEIIGTAAILFFIKSDVKAVVPDGSLYLSSTDALSTALSYQSDTLRLLLQTAARENMEEQTSPIGQTLKQCTRVKDLPPSLYIDLVIQIHHHFVSRFLIDSLHEH